jgi:hypothetical protein
MIQASNEQKVTKGNSVRFLLTVLGLAFLALIGATWYTVRIALAGHEPVIDKFYYEKGLNYEKEIAKKKQLQVEGYRFESIFDEKKSILKKGLNEIQVGFFLKDTPVNGVELFITRERTATSKLTEKKEITFDKNGIYKANLDFPFDGQWQITLTANLGERAFEKTYLVFVK